jgi:hypothetical protein
MLIRQKEETSDDDQCDRIINQNNVLQIQQTNATPEPNADKNELS